MRGSSTVKEQEMMQIRDIVGYHLRVMGISVLKDYEILLETITLAIFYYYNMGASYQKIYQEVAEKMGKLGKGVERALVRITQKAYYHLSDSNYRTYFGNTINRDRGYLTVTELIAAVVEASVNQTKTEKKVGEHLKRIGISLSTKGYRYLKSAIIIYAENPNRPYGTMGKIYAEVAEKFETTVPRVERAMGYAIGEAHKNTMPYDVVKEYFPQNVCLGEVCPTNSMLILAVEEHLSM